MDGVQAGGVGRGGAAKRRPWIGSSRVHTPLPWPLLVPLPERHYLPSTITRTPMCPTKPSLNVAASGIPGGSYNTWIKIPTPPFLQPFNLFEHECPRQVRPAPPRAPTVCRQGDGAGREASRTGPVSSSQNLPLGQARRLGGSNIWAWTWSSGHSALGQPRRRGGTGTSAPAS